jgi:4-hydroxy-tetrahydrodipicolinate synthase
MNMSIKNKFDFKGVISALPTPFYQSQVDFDSLEKLVNYQLMNGINGFVVNGTTAESPTLTLGEVERIFQFVQKISNHKVPLILGTGSNSTLQTSEFTKKAYELGADAALVVVPYYNKPPQRGLEKHFTEVAQKTNLPIILYNVPGRTITSLAPETITKLTQQKNIIAIKEASGDLMFDEEIKSLVPESFLLLSGDDPTYLPFLKIGGHGIISVMSNAITSACVKWTQLANEKKWAEAEGEFAKHKDLINLMYCEANPIPLKWILHKMKIFRSAEARLPLVELDAKYFEPIEKELKKLELI